LIDRETVAARGGPEWLRDFRHAAQVRLEGAELPTDAEEIWRYSRIGDLDLAAFRLDVAPPVGAGGAAGNGMAAPSTTIPRRAATVVVDNGTVTSIEVAPDAAEAGLRVRTLADGPPPAGLGQVAGSPDVFVDLSAALVSDGVVVEFLKGAVISDPVVVSHRVSGDGWLVPARTVVSVGPNAQGTVVEEVVGDGRLLHVPVVELDLAEGSNLDYASVQVLGPVAWQIGCTASRLGRDANLRSLAVALGGDYARVRTDSRLVATGASSRLLALYFGDGDQMHDFRTLQDHLAPKTTSDLLFKGAVQDRAQGVYSGLIRVEKGAAGSNAFQTNRNLVLSEGATAWSVPNLEIEDNDVRCSHASAVGPVDEEQLYYLESRGVRPEVAARLIVLGFFQDLLRGAPVPLLHEELRLRVAAKLVGER
jgi:Fe-S cluster assembly protein SufD